MIRIRSAPARFAWLAIVPLIATGCSVEKLTGDVMANFSAEHLVPFMMAGDDVNMACQTGVSLGSFLMSFELVGTNTDRAALVSLLSAAMCAEASAREAELRRLRAIHEKRTAEAQDALTVEKQAHVIASRRYWATWERLNRIFGPVGQGECPKMADKDELFYLLGLSAGVLAVMHDGAADGVVNVPKDIPAEAERAAGCLSNDKWWGVPSALQAAIWVVVPPLKPTDKDPWAVLAAAAKTGEAAHVRLASAFAVQTLIGAGKREEAKKAIAEFAAAEQASPPDPRWKLLDANGVGMNLHESDKIWTEETGHRTPFGQLGTFPESKSDTPEADPFHE